MNVPTYISSYWGKAQPKDFSSIPYHPLAYHMLDVAATARALLNMRNRTRHNAARLLTLSKDDAITLNRASLSASYLPF